MTNDTLPPHNPDGNNPPLVRDDHYTVTAGGRLVIDAAHGLLVNDLDPEGGPLRVRHVSLREDVPDWGEDGSFTFVSRPSEARTVSFGYAITDDAGSVASGRVTIHIENSAPTAHPDVYRVHAGQSLTLPASAGPLANDTDPEGNALRLRVGFRPNDGNLVSLGSDGSVHFVPQPGFLGTVRVPYTASDGYGGQSSSAITFEVTNTAPEGGTVDYWLHPGRRVDFKADALIARVSDPDGDALRLTAVDTAVLARTGKLLQQSDGGFAYQPNADFEGVTSFAYSVSDAFGGKAVVQARVHVGNQPPEAMPDLYTVIPGTRVANRSVLANDSDAEGDALRVTSFDATGLHGQLTIRPDGTFSFVPEPGFGGRTSATYFVDDGFGVLSKAQVIFDVVMTTASQVDLIGVQAFDGGGMLVGMV